MFFKRIVHGYVAIFCTIFFGAITFLITIDPLDIWQSARLNGINNYKIKQGSYLDIMKAYQYENDKPDIVYIGSSRVYVGLPSRHPEVVDEKVYNMGLSSLSLPDAREYLRFMYKIHKPRKIYMGLDFFQFSKQYYYYSRAGYEQQRLDALKKNIFEATLYKVQDTVSLYDVAIPTIIASRQNQSAETLFLRGWDVVRGTAKQPNRKEYYYAINSFMADYTKWEYAPEALEDLKTILLEAEQAGVEFTLFFNPISIDLIAAMDSTNKLDEFFLFKERVAAIREVYDFTGITPTVLNRNEFYDASHYRADVGVKMIDAMVYKKLCEPDGVVLNQENAEAEMNKQKSKYVEWKKRDNHFQYVEAMRLHGVKKERIEDAILDEYVEIKQNRTSDAVQNM